MNLCVEDLDAGEQETHSNEVGGPGLAFETWVSPDSGSWPKNPGLKSETWATHLSIRPPGKKIERTGCLARRSLGSIDRQAQFALCSAEVLLGFGAVAHHVEMIGLTCTLHLIEGLDDMFVHVVKIVPVVDLCGQYRTCCKC
jgi:hypothetical protein